MDIEKIKEDLSICYLKMIAATNGIALDSISHDEDSVDAVIKKKINLDKMDFWFNSQISVQLKSTSSISQYSIGESEVTYRLKTKNYNDLCLPATMPSILALLILPKDQEEWIQWTPEELMMKGKMYWFNLQKCKPSDNKGTVSIKIPLENILNNETINHLLERVAEEGCL